MTDYLVLILAGVVVMLLVLLAWLLREHQKLKQDCRSLASQLKRNQDDVAGLCSAAVAVDKRLAANDVLLKNIIDEFGSQLQAVMAAPLAASSKNTQGYDDVIQRIRRGASVDDLVRDCGVTRDEALLLTRLHGGK